MTRAFRFDHFTGIDGSILVTNDGRRVATEQDMDRFFSQAEPDLDRLTLEMCQEERKSGHTIPPWLLKAELEAFQRQRRRSA